VKIIEKSSIKVEDIKIVESKWRNASKGKRFRESWL